MGNGPTVQQQKKGAVSYTILDVGCQLRRRPIEIPTHEPHGRGVHESLLGRIGQPLQHRSVTVL
jgi:hypothetical protein